MEKPIRTSAKAVLIRNGRLLCIEHTDENGVFYGLPGGGQHKYETLPQALVRECFEEAGVDVQVGDLLYVREYIGKRHDFSLAHAQVHQIEFLFACTLAGREDCRVGDKADRLQTGVRWLPLSQLGAVRIYPSVLKDVLPAAAGCRYLGDCN